MTRQIDQNSLNITTSGQDLSLGIPVEVKECRSPEGEALCSPDLFSIEPGYATLLGTGPARFSSVLSFDPNGISSSNGSRQATPLQSQAGLLAENFKQQESELNALEKELKKISTHPEEIQEEMLSFVEGLGVAFLQFSSQVPADDPNAAEIQEKLSRLASHTYEMLARVTDGSAEEEIKIKAAYYEGLSKLALGNIEGAKFEFEKVRERIPEADERLKLMEQDQLRKTSLAALQVWKETVAEKESVVGEKQKGILGSFLWVADYWKRGDGLSSDDDRAIAAFTDNQLIDQVKELILTGEYDTINNALYYLTSVSKDPKIKQRAWEFYQAAQPGGVRIEETTDLIPRLIEFTATEQHDPALALAIYDKANELKNANIEYGARSTLGIHAILHENTEDDQIKRLTQYQLEQSQLEKGFKDYLASFLMTTDPDTLAMEVILMAGAAYTGTRVGLATLDKLRKAGTVGWKGLVAAKGAEIGAEGSALWVLNTSKDLMLHDPTKVLDPKRMAMSYGSTMIMIGYLKGFGALGETYAPRLARWFGLTKQATPELSAAGRALAWTVGHGAGMGGMVASTQTSEALGLQETPLGGMKESLVHDIFGYVRFALAHRLVDGAAGGRLTKFSHQNVQEKALKTAQVKVEGELPTLGHAISSRQSNGDPVFKDPSSQKLYEQLTYATLTRPGFSPAKLTRLMQKKDLREARDYAGEYHLGLRIENERLTEIFHRAPESDHHTKSSVGVRDYLPLPVAATTASLLTFLAARSAEASKLNQNDPSSFPFNLNGAEILTAAGLLVGAYGAYRLMRKPYTNLTVMNCLSSYDPFSQWSPIELYKHVSKAMKDMQDTEWTLEQKIAVFTLTAKKEKPNASYVHEILPRFLAIMHGTTWKPKIQLQIFSELYDKLPKAMEGLRNTGWTTEQQTYLFTQLAKKTNCLAVYDNYSREAFDNLPQALEAMRETYWTPEQQILFLTELPSRMKDKVGLAYDNLPETMKGFRNTDWTPEQQIQFLIQLAGIKRKRIHCENHPRDVYGLGAYEGLPKAMEGLRDAGWSPEQQVQLLIAIAEKSGDARTAYQSLPKAMEGLRDTGWSAEQQILFLTKLAEEAKWVDVAYNTVSAAMKGLREVDWTIEQQVDLVSQVAEVSEAACESLPKALEGLRDTGWSPKQQILLIIGLAKASGGQVEEAYESLPNALTGLRDTGWSPEQQIQFLTELAKNTNSVKTNYDVGEAFNNLERIGYSGWSQEQQLAFVTMLAKEGYKLRYRVPVKKGFSNALAQMREREWTPEQQIHFLTTYLRANRQYFSAIERIDEALPAALEGIREIGWTPTQQAQLFTDLAETSHPFPPYKFLPNAMKALRDTGWSPEQSTLLLAQIAKKMEMRVYETYEKLPQVLTALRENGWTPEQQTQLLTRLAENEKHDLELAYKSLYPVVKTMRDAEWTPKQQCQLLTQLAENAKYHYMWKGDEDIGRTYQGLATALEGLQNSGWTREQQTQLLNQMAGETSTNAEMAFKYLSQGLEGLRGTGWTTEQQIKLLTQLAQDTGRNVGEVYTSLPAALEGLRGTGWTSEQQIQLLTQLAQDTRSNVKLAFEFLSMGVEAVQDIGWSIEQQIQFLIPMAQLAKNWIVYQRELNSRTLGAMMTHGYIGEVEHFVVDVEESFKDIKEDLQKCLRLMRDTDWTDEQNFKLLIQLVEKRGWYEYNNLPAAIEAIRDTGWTPEQKFQLLMTLASREISNNSFKKDPIKKLPAFMSTESNLHLTPEEVLEHL